jgi:hypothetical protein
MAPILLDKKTREEKGSKGKRTGITKDKRKRIG